MQKRIHRGADKVVTQNDVGVMPLDLAKQTVQHHAFKFERLDFVFALRRLLFEPRGERRTQRPYGRKRAGRQLLGRRRILQRHVPPYTRTHSDDLALVLLVIDDGAECQTHDCQWGRLLRCMRIGVGEWRHALWIVDLQLQLRPCSWRTTRQRRLLYTQPARTHDTPLEHEQLKGRRVRAKCA